MADITLQREQAVSRTVVPNSFIDGYMIHANGEYVKVYLYLLRCIADPNMAFSISDCADKFDHTEKDIIRALKYWEKMHLIRLEYNSENEINCICLTDCNIDAPAHNSHTGACVSPQPEVSSKKKQPSIDDHLSPVEENILPEKTIYSASALRQIKNSENELSQTIFIVEQYLGKPMSSNDLNTVIYWSEVLGMDIDLIDYLVERSVASGHKSIRYMDAIAIEWHKQGITTVENAKCENDKHNALFSQIHKAFGITGRNLASNEKDYVILWSKDYGFKDELILEACMRTINTIHQPDFRYTDSILKKWLESNVSTISDVQSLDDKHKQSRSKSTSSQPKKAYTAGSQRSYSVQELEKELLTYGTN